MRQIDTKWMHPASQIVKVISRIYKKRQTTSSGGNISILDENGDIWMTPSGIDKGNLSEKDIVCVKKDGTIVGKHKPSSEYPFHKAIYDGCPEIKAIIHAHPPALVAFSIVREIPNTRIIPKVHNVCGLVGCARYALPGSVELSKNIANEFITGKFKAIIMENHGMVVGGSNLADAYTRFETLEYCCQMIINSKAIGEPIYLDNEQIKAFEDQFQRNFPQNEYVSYPSDERSLRKEICDIVRRACEQELMISSFGTVSVRWKEGDFLITPTNFVRWELEPEDIVQIKDGKAEPGKVPSRSVNLHQQIYRKNPHIQSIISAQSPYLMAFGISWRKFDVRTITESWMFLQDVPTLAFGSQFNDNETIPELLSKGINALLIQNDTFIATGNSLLQTFDRLEVAEFTAKSLILGSSLGKIVPINDEQIMALSNKFLK